jgi:vesicular inhibitory amino acid transporter
MRQRARFTEAVAATTAGMTGMYLLIGCVGYARLGRDFDHSKPVTSVLPNDAWTLVANAGLLAHCIVAYMVRVCLGFFCT